MMYGSDLGSNFSKKFSNELLSFRLSSSVNWLTPKPVSDVIPPWLQDQFVEFVSPTYST
jgi:hypothetical protein